MPALKTLHVNTALQRRCPTLEEFIRLHSATLTSCRIENPKGTADLPSLDYIAYAIKDSPLVAIKLLALSPSDMPAFPPSIFSYSPLVLDDGSSSRQGA